MNVALAGSSGLVGRALLKRLIADERITQIWLPLRRDSKQSWHEKIVMSVEPLAEQFAASPPFAIDIAFCCLGTTMKVAKTREAFYQVDHDLVVAFAQCCQAKHSLVVSSMGADARSKNFYLRTKGEMQTSLMNLALPQLTMVQPSLLLGPRLPTRPGEQFAAKVLPLLAPLMVGKLKNYRPIEAFDVAKALHHLAFSSASESVRILLSSELSGVSA